MNKLLLFGLLIIGLLYSCKPNKDNKMNQETTQKVSYANAYLSFVPLRAEASHRSEMVTQVVFGEYLKVLNTKGGWCYVELLKDHYQGWIELRQINSVSEKEYLDFSKVEPTTVTTSFTKVKIEDKEVLLTKGSILPFYSEGAFLFNGVSIPYNSPINQGEKNVEALISTAKTYLNTPYLWGGKTEFGLDCSGFSQIVYQINGYTINRDASQQAKQGELIAFLSEAQEGDLAFFDEDERITHVGIVLKNNQIIHAAQGKVRIDSLDTEGIYNAERKKYTHHLRLIKRIIK
jgi:cell wall-associated NlpC family hydrolase